MQTSTLVSGFFLALALVLVILGGIVTGSASKVSDDTAHKNIKNSGTGVLVIGLIFLVGSAYSLYSEYSSGSKTMYF